MAQLARSIDPVAHHVALPSSPAAILRLSDVGDATDSPARELHDRLLRSFATAPAPVVDKLPLNTRLAAIAGLTMAPWVAIGTAVYFALA